MSSLSDSIRRFFVPSLGHLLALAFLPFCSFAQEQKSEEKPVERIPMWLLFSNFTTEKAAMSPDGKYLAYTLRENDTVSVVVLDIDKPSTATTKVAVVNDEAATKHLDSETAEKTPGQVTWMRWVSPDRLVVQTNARSPMSDGGAWLNAPPGAIMSFKFDGSEAKVLVTARDISQITSDVKYDETAEPGTESSPEITKHLAVRAPSIVDLVPGNQEEIIIRESPASDDKTLLSFATYRLNVRTGKLKLLDRYFLTNGFSTLLDSKGVPKINIPMSVMDKFPHKFRFMYGGFFEKEKELNVLAAGKPIFEITPTNFAGKRSVPLSIDEERGILYYASNIERDTFGVYGLDLKTGKRTGVSFENGVFDLYKPQPGRFPDHYVSIATNHIADISGEVRDKFVDGGPLTAESNGRIISTQVICPNHETDVLVRDRHDGKFVGIRFEGSQNTASWVLPELNAVQMQMANLIPGANVDILDWDSKRTRFLIRAESPLDPGSFFIFDRTKSQLAEYVRSTPAIPRESLNLTGGFSFKHPGGESVHGLITLPRYVRRKPAPLVIVLPALPWQRVLSRYNAEAQAFATMGFAVAEISSRSAWGYGAKAREGAATNYEQNLADDLKLTADSLCKRFGLDRHRVSLYGVGLGGFGAVWAMQLYPEHFRCAMVINPITDPTQDAKDAYRQNDSARAALELGYLGGPERMESRTLVKNVDKIKRPVAFLVHRGPDGGPRLQSHIDAESIFVKIRAQAKESEFHDLDADFENGLPLAKSKAFHEMEGFLNTTLYDYDTKAGETKVIEQLPAKDEKTKH